MRGAASLPRVRRGVRVWRRPGRMRRQEYLWGYLLILPWLLGFFLWTAGPMMASIVISFLDWEIVTPPKWAGFGNYLRLFHDDLFLVSLANTAYYTFLGVPLHLAVALLAALLLTVPLRGVSLLRTAFYLPSIVPSVANTLLWVWILNPTFGLANAILRRVSLPPLHWLDDPMLSKPTLILMSLWTLGNVMVIFIAGLEGVPATLYEAAQLDGAGRWSRFRHVTLPMISPVIFFNLVVSLIGSFQVFTVAYIATGGGPENSTLFYLLYLYRNGFEYFRMGYASALAWVLFLIIALFTVVQFRLSRRWVYYEVEKKRP